MLRMMLVVALMLTWQVVSTAIAETRLWTCQVKSISDVADDGSLEARDRLILPVLLAVGDEFTFDEGSGLLRVSTKDFPYSPMHLEVVVRAGQVVRSIEGGYEGLQHTEAIRYFYEPPSSIQPVVQVLTIKSYKVKKVGSAPFTFYNDGDFITGSCTEF